jgi:peptidoglycan/LPS O-acetylase OafA/YrhL
VSSIPESAPTQARRVTYVPALDGMRGISLPGTIYTHFQIFLGFLPTAPWWVRRAGPFTLNIEMFFVLSGALITSLLVAEFQRSNKIALDSFYLRRSRRLGPALLAVVPLLLLSQFLLPGSGSNPLGESALTTALLILFFMGNWQLASGGNIGWLGPAWTLGIEEQFYLTWPSLLRAALRRGWTRQRLLLAVWSVIAICVGISALLVRRYPAHHAVYMTPVHVPPILLGCALGYVLMTNPDGWFVSMLRHRTVAVIGFGGMVAISALFYTKQTFLLSGGYVLYAGSACLLIGHCMAVADQPSLVSRVLGWKPFVVIGQVSYEAYLVHCVVILAVLQVAPRMPVADMIVLDLALIAVISGAFYYLIERPIRRYGWTAAFRRRERAARPAPRPAVRPARSRAGLLTGFASATAVVVAAVLLVATAKSAPTSGRLGAGGRGTPVAQGVATPEQLLGVDSGGVTPQSGSNSTASGQASGGPSGVVGGGGISALPAGGRPGGSASETKAPTLEAPTITSITPPTGIILGGNTLTIRGRHLTRDAKVFFDTVRIRQVTWLDNRTLRIVVPSAQSVAVSRPLAKLHGLKVAVRVVTAGGQSATGVGDVYTYI